MQTKVIKLDPDRADIVKIKQAANLIDSGGLVAFPTETVYGIACRVEDGTLAKLNKIKARDSVKRYTLHIGQKKDVTKYVPAISLRAKKLLTKFWPGPVTIVFELSEQDLEKQQKNLKREVFESLYNNGTIGIRCPDNPIASILLRLTHKPVVAPSANVTGQEPAVEPEQVLAQLSGQIEMLLDAGPCRYKQNSTVVKIGKKEPEILRPGVISEEQLRALSTIQFLFVCTGNTCRSPMAEGIFCKYLAEKLGCTVDELKDKGYKVTSAGIIDIAGIPASREAVSACEFRGIDIRGHKSSIVSAKLVEESDVIFAMDRNHCRRITELSPDATDKCVLLADNEEIPDPIGQSQCYFNHCAELIETAVRKRIGELII